MARKRKPKPVIGWREWISFPELGDGRTKAKIDTGARTSALHAFDLEVHDEGGLPVATFELHPRQRSAGGAVAVSHPVTGFRRVRSSNGKSELRPVIVTLIQLGDQRWPIEVTLTARDQMGFRMLLGRAAVRGRFVIDPGRSYVQSSNTRSAADPKVMT